MGNAETLPPIPLWSEGELALDPSHDDPEEMFPDDVDGFCIRNVVVPTLTPVLPQGDADPARPAVIVAPGGGFHVLCWTHEGTMVAERLTAAGIACFLLKYRVLRTDPTKSWMALVFRGLLSADGTLPPVSRVQNLAPEATPLAYADGAQAVRIVRERAAQWSVDPERVGFLGFSAGAFVATATALNADLAARPDFVAPIYGGSVEADVDEAAPPLFTTVAADDGLCFEPTMNVVRAWQAAGRPTDVHVFSRGGHGFGARPTGLPVDAWLDLFIHWARADKPEPEDPASHEELVAMLKAQLGD